LRGIWTGDQFSYVGVELERPAEQGRRLWLTEAEFAKRLADARESDADKTEINGHLMPGGSGALATWLQASTYGRRSSLIINPPDGRLPPLTPRAEALVKAGRTSWNKDQPIEWVSDLDALDRCVARGFPSAMLPTDRDAGNGIRIFQSPGFVAFQIEQFGTRVIRLNGGGVWPPPVRGWLGESRGHWEGATLVIETAGIVAGDSANRDVSRRAASPASAKSTIPVGEHASTVERLTMTARKSLIYQVTYTDPDVFTVPWTVQVEWMRDDTYRIYEFACHEGNVQVRHMITGWRARQQEAALSANPAQP
jgi:hypothetical protein